MDKNKGGKSHKPISVEKSRILDDEEDDQPSSQEAASSQEVLGPSGRPQRRA
jgi:hypothetical protein